MANYGGIFDKHIKPKSKYRHFKFNTNKKFYKCKHIKITFENRSINDIDEICYNYIIEHNKKYDFYFMKCEFKLVFIDNRSFPYVTSDLNSNKTMCFWYKFLGNVISDFKDKEYNFNHIAEKIVITISNKLDMSYDLYIKHNMCARDRKLDAMINKS